MKLTKKKRLETILKEKLPEVIKAIQNGDSSKTEEFAVLLMPYINLVIYKFSKFLDDDITCITSEIIMKLITKINTIDLSKSVVGFIARSAINHCIDTVSKNKNRLQGHVNRGELPLYKLCYEESGMSNLDSTGIDFYIENNFTEDDAQVVALYFIDQKSLSEISSITGHSEKHITETIQLLGEPK